MVLLRLAAWELRVSRCPFADGARCLRSFLRSAELPLASMVLLFSVFWR